MVRKQVRLNQEEIIRLGTPKPSFSYKDRMLISLNEKDGISQMQLSRNMGGIHVNGNFYPILKLLTQQKLIRLEICPCGQGKILYITSLGRKYARSLKK